MQSNKITTILASIHTEDSLSRQLALAQDAVIVVANDEARVTDNLKRHIMLEETRIFPVVNPGKAMTVADVAETQVNKTYKEVMHEIYSLPFDPAKTGKPKHHNGKKHNISKARAKNKLARKARKRSK